MYGKKNEEWVLAEKIQPLQEAGSYFGGSLAIHGNRMVLAAPGKKTIFVYAYDSQSASWKNEGSEKNDHFSPIYSQMGVAIEGDKLAVVAKGVGVSMLYKMDRHGKFSHKVVLKAKGESVDENQGKSVAIKGGLVFTGRADRSRLMPGAVYVHDVSE